MKAVENTLVLTFCQTAEENELFSIILTRHPNSLMEDVSYRQASLYFLELLILIYFSGH